MIEFGFIGLAASMASQAIGQRAAAEQMYAQHIASLEAELARANRGEDANTIDGTCEEMVPPLLLPAP